MLKTWLLIVLLGAPSLRAETVSMGVGLVKGQLVTSREVQIQNLLEVALYEPKAKEKIKVLAIDSKAFGKATQDALLESVVALEAENFNVIQVSSEELSVATKTVLKVLRGNKVWLSLQVAERELEAGLRHKIQSKKFIQFRAQSSVLPITDSEAQRYFNENRLKFGSLPFENFKENIKSYLSRTQVDRRLKDWFEVLLNKYQVKNLIAGL